MLQLFAKIIVIYFLISLGFIADGLRVAQASVDFPRFTSKSGTLEVMVVPCSEKEIDTNLVSNASFEEIADRRPQNWNWKTNQADATFKIINSSRSGKHAILITNNSPKIPHVYGQLAYTNPINLTPGKTYTISAYVNSNAPGHAWIGGGGDSWWVRLRLKSTNGKWRRFEKSFTAKESDKLFRLMIISNSPTDNLIIDDIKIEKGEKATPFWDIVRNDNSISLFADIPERIESLTNFNELLFDAYVYLNRNIDPMHIKVSMADKGSTEDVNFVSTDLYNGFNHLKIRWTPKIRHERKSHLSLQAGALKKKIDLEFFTPADYDHSRAIAQVKKIKLEEDTDIAIKENIPIDYQKAALAITKRFIKIAGLKYSSGMLYEAIQDLEFLSQLCTNQIQTLQDIRHGKKSPFVVPDLPVDQIKIHDGNFWVGNKPILLIGALGYGELQKALPMYRDYGFNVIGDDYDVYSSFKMLKSDNTIDKTAVPNLIKSWKQLYDMNLAVSYTPHLTKIPDWALEKYPDIIGGRSLEDLPKWDPVLKRSGRGPGLYGRFFPFAIDSPNLKQLVERYYTELFPNLKNIPGFRVFWMMNEPSYKSCDAHYLELFRGYLQRKFSNIKSLNAAWKTQFHEFAEIDCLERSTETNKFDWLTFHQDQVSKWFEWLFRQVKRHDSSVILSNKPSCERFLNPQMGIDFEREALLWDIPGSDTFRKPDHWQYAYDWSKWSIMLLDFQRSIAPQKPLADHELHFVHEPNIDEKYVRTAYLHSYLHGLRMSQFWLWATGALQGKCNAPGLKHTAWSQPKAAWGTASSALDLRRLSHYVTAFPSKPQVMIYFSRPSLFLLGDAYADILTQTYEAANGLDAPIGFITDRMIQSGELSDCRLLIVSGARFIEKETRSAIFKYIDQGGHIAIEEGSLKKNEYKVDYPITLSNKDGVIYNFKYDFKNSRLKELAFQFDKFYEKSKIKRPIRLLQPNGKPSWPIEARAVSIKNGMLVYLVGLNKKPMKVRLLLPKKETGGQDLINNIKVKTKNFEINPLDVRFLKFTFQPR
nr:beta-galactosidase [uncultured Desulfobacter sp.]